MSREIKKILVIKLSALGDFVLALAAMKKIRQVHKRAHITLLTTPPFESLAKACPYFNAVETDGRPEGLGEWLALRKRIKAAKYDRVYDLQTSAQSARIFHMLAPFPPESPPRRKPCRPWAVPTGCPRQRPPLPGASAFRMPPWRRETW